jgi:hypothetical protein
MYSSFGGWSAIFFTGITFKIKLKISGILKIESKKYAKKSIKILCKAKSLGNSKTKFQNFV